MFLHRQEESEKLCLFSLKMPKRLRTFSDLGRFIQIKLTQDVIIHYAFHFNIN